MVPAPSCKVSRVSQYSGSCLLSLLYAYGALTLFGVPFQAPSALKVSVFAVLTPPCSHGGLGSSHFARRYSGNRCFFLFLRLLRCFSSPGPPPCVMCWRMDTQGPPAWVSPFRHLRITGYLPLPAAFRSLSRLSSAPSAKASALCPYLLDLVLSSCSPARPRGIALPPAGRMVAHAYKSLRYIVQNN